MLPASRSALRLEVEGDHEQTKTANHRGSRRFCFAGGAVRGIQLEQSADSSWLGQATMAQVRLGVVIASALPAVVAILLLRMADRSRANVGD